MTDKARWVRLHTYVTPLEAELAIQTLDAEGIPGITRGNDLSGIFGPGFQGATAHGVDLLVPSVMVAEARDVLDLPKLTEAGD